MAADESSTAQRAKNLIMQREGEKTLRGGTIEKGEEWGRTIPAG